MSIYSAKLAASIPDYLCISSLALAILFTAIAPGVSLITNALDELKNSDFIPGIDFSITGNLFPACHIFNRVPRYS
ncbi:hypothetical protein [Nostoc sp.]|uniref:hypothetical protein n=1 Tax=Nostoc sp. TaxID=1180 RepID=UPI002FF92F8D